MPCGQQLIEAVAGCLREDTGTSPEHLHVYNNKVTMRAIRYAITELIKSGRARRDKRNGPIYAVNGVSQQLKESP